jgi:hypothetical protein
MIRNVTLVAGLALSAAACQETDTPVGPSKETGTLAAVPSATNRQYGSPVKLGNGSARTYVIFDKTSGAPVELGVALSDKALDGLPAPMGGAMEGHEDMHEFILPLPKKSPAPYQFVELDWNPAGHSAPYHNQPHFDFHFHKFTLAERNAIDSLDPLYAERAANFPQPNYIPAGWFSPSTILGVPPVDIAIPRMGIHWIDPTSPEYPPQSRIFTHTFIVGTWDGRVTFYEPMVSREFMLNQRAGRESKVDKAVPVAQRHSPAGYYPDSYRVIWDVETREYRVALTGLAWHQ